MKRIVCIVLILCTLTALTIPAAAEKKCSCGQDPVIYVCGFGAALYADEQETQRIYPPATEAFEAQKETIIRAAVALLFHRYRRFADLGMQAAQTLLGALACDARGNIVPGTGIGNKPLPTKDVHGQMLRDVADYAFYYDWRLSPLDNAELLHTYVQRVQSICGHDKVSLVCHSMGNTLLASYLYLYGSADLSHAVCLAPAWKGVSIMGSLLSGEARICDKSRELDLFLRSIPTITDARLQKLIRFGGKSGLYPILLWHLQRALNSQFNRVFCECLRGLFGTMPGIWAFVPDAYYDSAKAFTFGGDPQFDALCEKVDLYHENVQLRLTDLLTRAMEDGMQLTILSGYGISTMPLSYAHTAQSDFLIDTTLTSIGAVCAPFGSTLAQGVHLSPDRTVDAGTCFFPQQTWFVRGLMHFDYPTEAIPFVRWAVAQTAQPTVQTSAQFPAFLSWDADSGLCPESN